MKLVIAMKLFTSGHVANKGAYRFIYPRIQWKKGKGELTSIHPRTRGRVYSSETLTRILCDYVVPGILEDPIETLCDFLSSSDSHENHNRRS